MKNFLLGGITSLCLWHAIGYCFSEWSRPNFSSIERIPSLGGKYEAVVAEIETHATVARTFYVYLVLPGESPQWGMDVLKTYHSEGVQAQWADNNTLLLRPNGNVLHFTDTGYIRVGKDFVEIHITLKDSH